MIKYTTLVCPGAETSVYRLQLRLQPKVSAPAGSGSSSATLSGTLVKMYLDKPRSRCWGKNSHMDGLRPYTPLRFYLVRPISPCRRSFPIIYILQKTSVQIYSRLVQNLLDQRENEHYRLNQNENEDNYFEV
jgi:hypothetical protein